MRTTMPVAASLAVTLLAIGAAATLSPTADWPIGWRYLGCYTDSTTNRVLGLAVNTDYTNQTGQNCINYCAGKGFLYAGTEYARECWCGMKLVGTSSVNASDCNAPCTGDASQACGGPKRLTVYTSVAPEVQVNPGVNGYISLGCYSDAVGARALKHIAQGPGGCKNNTVAGCTSTCRDGGYMYSGVEYAGECFCGNSIDNGQALVDGMPPFNGCKYPCRGNESEWCGGANRINLYQWQNTTTTTATSASSTTPTPTPDPTNIVINGDFEQGTDPWQEASQSNYSPSNLINGGSVITAYAEHGSRAYQIFESGYGDTGNRSTCLEQEIYHPYTAKYQLSFYYGRQSNPPPGSSSTDDAIQMWLYVDGNQIAVMNVCNPSKGECAIKLPSAGGNTMGGYNLFSGQLNADEGYHTVKICALYSSTKRGIQDYFLVDNVDAHNVTAAM